MSTVTGEAEKPVIATTQSVTYQRSLLRSAPLHGNMLVASLLASLQAFCGQIPGPLPGGRLSDPAVALIKLTL
jgi:hypothetical protein